MKNLKVFVLFVVTNFLSMTVCAQVYYAPPSQNSPLISEKGEFTIGFSSGIVDKTIFDRFNINSFSTAYGISDELVIKFQGDFIKESEPLAGGSGTYFEAGFGYYKPVGKFIFSSFANIGYGALENYFQSNRNKNGTLNSDLYSLSIQPSAGYKSKGLEASLSTKVSRVKYYNTRGTLQDENVNYVDDLKSKGATYFIEPAMTLALGIEKIKIQCQLIPSINFSKTQVPAANAYASLGLQARL